MLTGPPTASSSQRVLKASNDFATTASQVQWLSLELPLLQQVCNWELTSWPQTCTLACEIQSSLNKILLHEWRRKKGFVLSEGGFGRNQNAGDVLSIFRMQLFMALTINNTSEALTNGASQNPVE